MSARCGYCGRFMAEVDYGPWFGNEFVCSQQAQHILSDPEHWTVDGLPLGADAVDIDGDPISGHVRAELLTTEQLRTVVGLEPSGYGSDGPVPSE